MARKASAPVVAAAPAANSNNVADLLSDLAGMTSVKPAAKNDKKQRWRLMLDDTGKAYFKRWIEAKVVDDVTKKRLESAGDEFKQLCLKIVISKMWKEKVCPDNPEVKLLDDKGRDDCTAIFQIQDRPKFAFSPVPEGVSARDHYVTQFKQAAGFGQQEAEKIVDGELIFSPTVSLRSLSELLEGSYGENRQFMPASDEERAAGIKLANFLRAQADEDGDVTVPGLTSAEKMLVVDRKNQLRVKAGFFDRVANYCSSEEQLAGVIMLIQPVSFAASPKFAIQSSLIERSSRTVMAASEILGVPLSISEANDTKITFVLNGNGLTAEVD